MPTEVHQAVETVTTSNELDLLFGLLFDEYFNIENQVVSKSSVVTTTDESNKRQQQPDSTSSTSTLATTVTADGNFDFDLQSCALSIQSLNTTKQFGTKPEIDIRRRDGATKVLDSCDTQILLGIIFELIRQNTNENQDGNEKDKVCYCGSTRCEENKVNEARGAKDTLGYSFGESCIKDLESLHLGIFVMI
ncbi:hypothetical protein Tco_0940715 [Tanacetum coccineum]|uniref:Post-SET domain-containing protein n=1 Tax=Tanacetum coccineum TaxID=301880 RepID=A0ABQ5DNT1_9ASTR